MVGLSSDVFRLLVVLLSFWNSLDVFLLRKCPFTGGFVGHVFSRIWLAALSWVMMLPACSSIRSFLLGRESLSLLRLSGV